ncbi:DNA polymerase III subunit delta [Sagittula sp. MA-2]|jgi:DNA polymerase-3 subunit delta|uniref:DNA polymerase III subunit delta n=1 Tax=Sagittula sp. MA-2 TaxID=3048007 RepID=UPI0024C3AB0C|nr:DNA polymerase III subunit delta [Sagittula sp. MA-2]WHZ34576.1 DNA polymerase III subunit delta [Sagittula sp. MA-2]
MKLTPRDADAFFRKPDPKAAGLLIYGEDTMRVAMKRQEVVANLTGPGADEEMRITRLNGADLRRDPAALLDAVKATGFFPGARAVVVEEAGDGATDALKAALDDWREGDATIVATGGSLAAKSALRKLFEGSKRAFAAALYNNPLTRSEIEAELKRAGIAEVGRDAMGALEALGRDLTPGDFRMTLEKIALYKLNDSSPLSVAEVELNAPASFESDVDDVFNILAEGRTDEIAPVMQRLSGQGVTPVTLLIMGTRHFRMLYTLVSAPGGPAQGIGRLRPPVFGPRRDRILRQAQGWRLDRLEAALELLLDTDLTLRSAGQKAPAFALVERAFVRLAYLARR